MKSTSLCWLAAEVSLMSMALPFAPAAAQQMGTAPQSEAGAAPREASSIADIVVTARRREEALQTVPLAVTAFTGQALEDRQIRTTEGLSRITPSLSLNSPFGGDVITNVRLRGVPGVQMYFAEVPTQLGGSYLFVDVQNVQVLKGPQGVAFGMNTTGGAILLEPVRPREELGGEVHAILGDYGRRQARAILNLPVVDDKVLTRFVVERARDTGYTRDVLNDRRMSDTDYWYVRGSMTIRPSDSIESYTVFDFYNSDNAGPGVVLTAVNPTGLAAAIFPATNPPRVGLPNGIIDALDQQRALGVRRIVGYDPDLTPYRRDRQWRVVNNTSFSVTDNFTIKNIISYTRNQQAQSFDLEGSPFPSMTRVVDRGDWGVDTSTFTNEFQLSGQAMKDKFNWVAGYFLSKAKRGGDTRERIITLGGLSNRIDYGFKGDNKNTTEGLYAQGVLDFGALSPGLDGLRLTGGYRYTWDKRQQVTSGRTPPPDNTCVTVGADPVTCRLDLSGSFRAYGYTAALDWEVRPNALIYIRNSRGYTSGGFNANAATPENRRYGPEYLTDVEAGMKVDWSLGGGVTLRTNAAGFYGWYKGIQRAVNVAFTDAQGRTQIGSFTQNAAKAHIKGVELETMLAFPFGLRATATYSHVRGKYDRFLSIDPVTLEPLDLSGMAFTNFPENQWTVSGQYQLPLPEEIGKISLSAFYTGQSRTYFGLVPDDVGALEPGYETLDLRIDWKDMFDKPIDAALFVTNVTNNTHRQGSFTIYTSLGTVGDVFAPPRMFGVELRYRFGGAN